MRGLLLSVLINRCAILSLGAVLILSSISQAETAEEAQIRILTEAFGNKDIGGTGARTKNSGTSLSTLRSRAAKSKKEIPFDSEAAPRPEVCFASFLKKASRAETLEELLPYLAEERREFYKSLDQVAKQDLSKEVNGLGINPFGNPASVDRQATQQMVKERKQFALDYYKALAKKIGRYVSTKIEGNRATIQVTAKVDVNVNGEKVTKADATVIMVGEGNYWRLVGLKVESSVN